MKKILILVLILTFCLFAQVLFEVKDASDNSVFEITNDGIRIFNYPDTLMIISSAEIRANLDNSQDKALSRSFSISTNTTGKGGLANVMEVTTDQTIMREGIDGDQYTDFSPENIFLGLNAGRITEPDGTWGIDNLFLGNQAGYNHTTGNDNIFIGKESGYVTNYGSRNVFMGLKSGYNNKTGADNVYIGNEAGLGYQSGSIYSNGGSNVAIGVNSGHTIKQAQNNVFTGYWSGYNTTDGDKNVFIGSLSGYKNSIENYNVYLGFGSGAFNNGERNVIVGAGDDDHMPPSDTVMNDCVFLGFGAGTYETNSNRLHIENSANTDPLIYGEFDNDIIKINGNLSVNAYSPTYRFYVKDDYMPVYGDGDGSGNYVYGVYGDADGGAYRNASIYGAGASGTGTNWGGYFNGDVNVGGTVVKSADEVKIDHPLDPKNKFLSHSTISSDQMTNIYHGNVILNSDGSAVVDLPEWFESINSDFRYQLTAIGAPGPNLYISKKISGNSFGISGGSANMEVSWMVTAIRNDKYAQKHRIQLEKDKNMDEKGYYLHPEAYDMSEEMGIEYQIDKMLKDELDK